MLTIEEIEAFKEDNLETGRKASHGFAGARDDTSADCGRDGKVCAAGEKPAGTGAGMAAGTKRPTGSDYCEWVGYWLGKAWLAQGQER